MKAAPQNDKFCSKFIHMNFWIWFTIICMCDTPLVFFYRKAWFAYRTEYRLKRMKLLLHNYALTKWGIWIKCRQRPWHQSSWFKMYHKEPGWTPNLKNNLMCQQPRKAFQTLDNLSSWIGQPQTVSANQQIDLPKNKK